jgi:hypothetical protein
MSFPRQTPDQAELMTFRLDLVNYNNQIVKSFTWETDYFPEAQLDQVSTTNGLVLAGGQSPLVVHFRRIL